MHETFLQKDIAIEFDLNTLPPEQKEEGVRKIEKIVIKQVLIKVTEKLSTEDSDALFAFIEHAEDPNEIQTFLQEKIPDFEDLVQREIDNLKKEGDIFLDGLRGK